MDQPISCQSQRAFTLIELLIVTAIIALLAAILFPVFSRIREKARQASCLSNEKQLALGILTYTQDSDEALPPVQRFEGAGQILWPDIIDSYVRNAHVRLCPSDAKAKVVSYGLNEVGFVDLTDNPPPPPVILAQFQSPSMTVMLTEVGTGDDFTTDRPDAYTLPAPDGPDDPPTPPGTLADPADARPAARHFGRANVEFMDGHVKALRLEQFYTGQTPPDKWFCAIPEDTASCHT